MGSSQICPDPYLRICVAAMANWTSLVGVLGSRRPEQDRSTRDGGGKGDKGGDGRGWVGMGVG